MAGLFDDVPEASKGANAGLFDDVPDAQAPTRQPRSFLGQLAADIGSLFGRSSSVLQTEPAQPNPSFDFNTASRVARAVDDGIKLPLPNTIQGDQAAVAAAAAQDAERRAGQNRRRFANENPVTAGLAAGSAQALTGLANAPFVAADAVNNLTVNPILRLFGADPLPAARAPGTDTLRQLAADYTAPVSKDGLSEAWSGDQFGTWLMSNLAQQAPQIAQSLAAAYFPALRPALLPAMGAQAAGSSFAEGDHSGVSTLKGVIEVGTEMLPLGVVDKVGEVLGRLPDGARRTVWNEAARRIAASGAALTANSITGAIEEAAAQFGGNAADRYLSGKNVGLFDDVDKAAVLGGFGGGMLSGPQVAGTLLQREEKAPADTGPTLDDYQALMARVFGQPTQARAPQQEPAPAPAQPAPQQPAPIKPEAVAKILDAIETAAPERQQQADPAQPGGMFDDIPQAQAQPAEQPGGADYAVPAERIDNLDQTGAEVSQPAPVAGAAMEGAGDTRPPQAATIKQPSNSQPAPAVAPQGTGTAPVNQQAPNDTQDDGPLGVDFTPVAQGGQPFKTNLEAKKARKLQPHLRVVKAKGGNGFVLVPKTAKQLAAEAQAAKRISTAKTGNSGKPMSAHEFVMSKGGLDGSARTNLVVEGNPRFGNRFLFAGKGKPGLTLAQAAELLAEAGYIKDESESAAADIIKRSITSPQYTAEGWERIAQAEQEARFEDYLQAGADDGDPLTLDDADLAELEAGDKQHDQADLQALIDQAEAAGIDAENLLEDAARITQNGSQDEYLATARQSLSSAIQGAAGGRGIRQADGDAGQGQQPAQAQRGDGAGGGQGDGRPRDARAAGQDQDLTDDAGDDAGMVRERGAGYDADLIIQHNLTAANLLHAVRMGGIPVPSLAITKKGQAVDSFGEITLLGSKELADPKGYARTKVFGADIYSPRYPNVTYELDRTALAKLNDILKPHLKDNGRLLYSGEIKSVEDLTQSTAFRNYMLDKTGKTDVWDLRSGDMDAEASRMLAEVGAKEKIFQGFTYSGNRRYTPHTLENVVKILKKELRGGENFNYGVGSLRAKFTPQFRSIEQIRKAKGNLLDKESFERVKDEIDAQLIELSDLLDLSMDQTIEVLEDAPKMGAARAIERAMKDYRRGATPDDDAPQKVAEFLTRLRNLPTEYFEAKVLRPVSLSEFAGAVVPEGVDQKVLDALRDAGVNSVRTYPKGNASARKAAVEQLADELQANGKNTVFERSQEYGSDQPDLFNQQLDLFLDSKPVETQAGPEVEAARQAAADALRDMRDMGNPLAMALSTDLAARQRVSLVGQTARTPEEFATLAQVYRDPRFETFRVVFVNDAGKIVSQIGLTMRMPAATSVIIGNDLDEYLDPLMKAAGSRGATGYYLLHNHPSGNPTPSRADERVTQAYAQHSLVKGGPKFKGHVVIDTNKYALIDKNGNWNIEQKDFGQPAPYGNHEWAGEAINGPQDAMRMVKRLQVDDGVVTLIVTNYQHQVLGVTSIPARSLTQDKERNRLVIAKATLGMKGAKVIAVSRDYAAARATSGISLDAFHVNDSGQVRSLVADGEARSGMVIEDDRNIRVSPDTSPEFDYLRKEALKNNRQRAKNKQRLAGKSREPAAGYRKQTDTPQFKRWFGDSKVVDDQGKPLVVYHGTAADFDAFNADNIGDNFGLDKEGFFFTNNTIEASGYADPQSQFLAAGMSDNRNQEPKAGANVMPVYLSVQNPLTLEAYTYAYYTSPRAEIDERGVSLIDYYDDNRASIVQFAKDGGHDGVLFRHNGRVLGVAFRPEQIKSAIGNNGNFDPADPSIVREDEPDDLWADRDAERAQQGLDLGAAVNRTYDPDKFKLRDLLGFERDAAGRRIWTAGRKGYDAGMSLARAVLGKVKLMDTKPGDFRAMMRKFQADNFNAQQRALDIAKAGQGMPPEMRSLLSDIIEKEVAVGDNTPEGLTEIAASMSAAFERQAQELIELGMMDKDRKVANYLPRVYRNPLIGKLQSREQMLGLLNKVRMRIRGDRLKSRGLTTMVPPGRVKDMERLGWKLSSMPDGSPVPVDLRSAIEKGKPVPSRFAEGQKVMMWRDFTKTEREEMGEVRDAFIRFAMGYVETQKDLALGRLFKAISENRKLSSLYDPGGWVKVSDKEVFGSNGLKMYGQLAGMYVEPQVADQLKRAIQDNSAVMQAYDKALSLWKEGKTVWNPVAHGNNIVSNLFMAHFAGINIANPKVWRTALKEYRTKGKLYMEAVENGLLGTEFANTEIQNALMPELKEFMSEADVVASRVTKMAEFLKRYPGKPVSWYREKMQNAYEFEDQIFKLMVYIDRRQAGADPSAAVDDAERYFFNYSNVPNGIRWVQRLWSPFFSYTYKALPAVLHTAATRPDRLLMPMALLGGANWLAYALLGDDGDEEEERKNMPDYMKGDTALGGPKMVRLPANSPEGNPYFLDMSRRIPLGDIFDLNNQMGGIPLLQPFMPSHPILWSVPLAIVGNKDNFTGRELVKKSDTEWEAAQKRAGYLYRQIVPNAPFVPGSYAWDKSAQGMASAFDAQLGPYTGFSNQGDKAKPWVAALDVTGVAKVRESNTERNKDFKMMDLRKEAQEVSANLRSLGRSVRNGGISQEDYNEQVAAQRKKLEVLREKMSEAR